MSPLAPTGTTVPSHGVFCGNFGSPSTRQYGFSHEGRSIDQKIIEQLPTSLAAQQKKPNHNMSEKFTGENLQIVIHVKGGYVVSVLSSTNPDIDVHVLDEDLDFHDDDARDCKTQWDIAVKTLKYEVLNGAGSI